MTVANVEVQGKNLSQQWIKAAVIGSIWAAIEIIGGSFLHNLKVPFSGTILSMVAVFLLVAFSMHWKERGIIIRAGIIAALMKSISPSAVILGPMFAIFMEGVILEFIWLLFGRNLLGYFLGGMFAVSWALVQKVLTLVILYGFDMVKIAESFYQFLVVKTGLEQIGPGYLILLIVFIYYIAGMLAALAGYLSFKRLQHIRQKQAPLLDIKSSKNPFGIQEEKQKYTVINLVLILLILVVSLYFLNSGNHILALIFGGGLIVSVLIRYRRSVRNLKKLSIWIQVLLITLLATMLWEWINTGEFFTVNGLIIGLEINFRAMVLIFSFSAISVELRNPIVRSLLYRNGFSNLYKALTLAFSSLPLIIERLPQGKNLFKQRKNTLGSIFELAEELLALMEREPRTHQNIFLVTGKVHSGKSTFTKEFVKETKKHISLGGFIASGTFKNNKRDSFSLTDISTGESDMLGSRIKTGSWIKHKEFYFNPLSFIRGEKIIKKALNAKVDLIVLDELGPMELAGKGWIEAIKMLENDFNIAQVWVVRERIVTEVKDRWHIPDENIYSIESTTFIELMDQIKKFLAKKG
jgi:nucleoside-triphosphatase THEP1